MAEFVEMILAQLIGNISTALILMLIYFNFLLFENYLRLIVWAIVCSQALRQAKNNVISVLQYLSDDADINRYGFLTCVFSKTTEIFISHPHDGSRRTANEMFLNYGIFLFSLIGAVSIWMRMYSWVSFLSIVIVSWITVLSLIKILDRRIFYYRYFFSDEVLVSVLLILGFFTTGAFVILFLGTESYLEGSRAATDLSEWVQDNFINDERTRQVWSEQVENSRAMISQAISGVENNFNDTMWWPPLKSLVKTYYVDAKFSDGNSTSQSSFFSRLSLPENMTLVEAVTFAYSNLDSVNMTSVQLTDWTSKGLEVSSIAVGSVAQLVFLVFTLVIAFVSLGIRSFFFVSSLFYLLCTNWDPVERFVQDLLPIQINKRPEVVRSLRKAIEGVFFLPLKMASIHAIVTMVSFTIVDADFMYLATTYVAFNVLDEMLYEKSIVALNSYVSALSVVLGVYVFGFEGVIFGPLIVCGVTFAYDVSNHGIQAAHDEHARSDEGKQDCLDGSDGEESRSTTSSFDYADHEKDKGFNDYSEGNADQGANTNIFSDAVYRVISGPLVDRVCRRLSMDVTTEGSVCVTLVVEGMKRIRKVRFVVNKSWTQKALHDNIRRMLHAHSVECISTADGVEVLSPLHIVAGEVLHVRVRPKHRLHMYADSDLESHGRVSFPVRALSPSYHGSRNVPSLPLSCSRDGLKARSPGTPIKAKLRRSGSLSFSVGVTRDATAIQRQVYACLQRKNEGAVTQVGGDMKRRESYKVVASSRDPAPSSSASSSPFCENLVHRSVTNLSSTTSSLAQACELVTFDENVLMSKVEASLTDDKDSERCADASIEVSNNMDIPSPGSVGSVKPRMSKPKFVAMSDSESFPTSPVSCNASNSFDDPNDANDTVEDNAASTAIPDMKTFAKSNLKPILEVKSTKQ
ncbi:unnamed protein product [Peronospora belbahrii]|uniref:Transmembrane protein n=1 Tax=Peronospora belbahrii TaxID=622444 RepID=A0AAU9L2E1_9STRA|nr:unnamed protein product [Peronospora belbahrii]